MESKEVAEGVGFLKKLFDFSFTRFVTLSIVKLIFAIAIVLCGLSTLGMIAGAFQSSAAAGVLMILLAPIVFLVEVIMARVWLEIVIVVFRIAEDTHKIAQKHAEESS